MQWALLLAAAVLMLAVRCLSLLVLKRKYHSKHGSVKTMIVLGSGGVLGCSAGLGMEIQLSGPVSMEPYSNDTARWLSLGGLYVHMTGGHTAEMLMLVSGLDKSYYTPRVYVVAETDKMSAKRALTREQEWASAQQPSCGDQQQQAPKQQQQLGPSSVSVEVIPRSREVGQSYLTSIFTTLYSLLWAFWMVTRHRPQLVLVNGPGTCIPVCAAAFVNRVLLWFDSRIIYVESIARVRKLSLSGTILYLTRMADKFMVQWPELQQRFPRSTYAGRLY